MESRGIYMSPDIATAKVYGDGLLVFNDRIGEVVKDWQRAVRSDDEALFGAFSHRIRQFQEFRRELVRRGVEVSPVAGREWGDNDANRSVRKALNEDLTRLGQLYASRSQRVYRQIDAGIERSAWLMGTIAIIAVALAALGALIIARAVARPLARITRITQAVAAGKVERVVPYGERHDEVGALARSIEVFQQTMRKNEELNRTVLDDAQARARRQEDVSAEISRFGGEVEATLAELGRISDQMLAAAGRLTAAADNASTRTTGAAAASAEASANVRDIASAADELAASVTEIDRQVAQSNAIAGKAVSEAEWTNAMVKELDEAAGRISDVVRLITDIAEQTNLLALNTTIEAARARRCRPRLCRGRERGEGARRSDRQGDRGYRCADFRHAACDHALDRSHRRHRADHPQHRRDQWRHRRGGHRAGRRHAGDCAQRGDGSRAHQRDGAGGCARRRGDGRDTRQRDVGEDGGRRPRRRRRAHSRPGRSLLCEIARGLRSPPSSSRRIERCGNVARDAAWSDQHGIEPDVANALRRVARQPGLGGADDSAALTLGHGPGGIIEGLPRLDLDKHQEAAASRHDVDLAERAFPAARQDAKALGDEIGRCPTLGRDAGAEGDDPVFIPAFGLAGWERSRARRFINQCHSPRHAQRAAPARADRSCVAAPRLAQRFPRRLPSARGDQEPSATAHQDRPSSSRVSAVAAQ